MKRIVVDKDTLLDAVTLNRAAHRDTYEQAMKGYTAAAHRWLSDMLRELEAGGRPRLYFGEPIPEDHTEEYDRVIAMLHMSVDEQIEVEEHEFGCYVLDDWGWKKQWSATNSGYLA